MTLGFSSMGIMDLASDIGDLETVGERASSEVMAQILQGITSFCESKAVLHVRQTTRAVLAVVRLREIRQ
jgi:hypothetical protein